MLRNSEGTTVDPVPFAVVTGMCFLVCYSFFPVYFLTLGAPVTVAVLATTGIFLVLVVAAYVRLVRDARPEIRGEVPAQLRLKKLFYYALAVAGLFLLLTMVLVAR